MKRKVYYIIVLLLVGIATAMAGSSAERDARSRRAKARYYYAQGAVEQAAGHEDAAYEYYRRAASADPAYEEAASAVGSRRLLIRIDTLQSMTELQRSLAMMRPFVDRYPGDTYEALYYGYAASLLDTLPEAIRVVERTYELFPDNSNILLQLSDAYARQGNLEKAVESISRYESQAGMSASLTMRKVSYLMADGDTVGAIREGHRLVDSSPYDVANHVLLGNLFVVAEMPDSAFARYSRAEEIDPESGSVKLALAEYYKERGDSVNYDTKMFETLLSDDLQYDQKVDLVADYLQGLISDKHDSKRGDYLFAELRNQYPHEPRVLDLAARYNAAKGDFAGAVEDISYALDMDPTNTIYLAQLMSYQSVDGHPEAAMETYQKALPHITPDENLKIYYANVAQLAQRYDEAEKTYKAMIDEIEPGLPVDSVLTFANLSPTISLASLDRLSQLIASLGDIYHAAGEAGKAYRAYDNAILFNSSNVMAKNNYAYFLATGDGDLDKAESLSAQTIDLPEGDNPTYLDTYAWIQYLKGNYDRALEYQTRAAEAMDNYPYQSAEIYDHLGDILEKKGEWEKALEAWNRAVEIQREREETDVDSYTVTLKKINEGTKHVKNATPKEKE